MKKILPFIVMLLLSYYTEGQITTPIIKANFGVDADLRSNYFNGFTQTNDDWFSTGNLGLGNFIIDTSGAAALMARYASDVNSRKLPFFRTMRFPAYTVLNNRLLIDAVFTRDYHGDDSTIFASGSNKNGMNPSMWSCPVSQSVPDKNEILDMMVHVRRAGPTTTDSLWMFGGVSIENTTGDRYFDFEMYQTDIYYDRPSRSFFGYGPDAGHTAWRFDAAGNITKPGDIIFTAEYGTSGITKVEARIWIDRASMSVNVPSFTWGGLFDGADNASQYGYANITPKTAGAFYTGLQSANNTWAGPFGLVLGNNSLQTNYSAKQFMEFSVNLTKLGLDPVTLLGGNACGMPFRRVLVKSRASTSFTSALKDFVGPFDFFLSQRAQAATDIYLYCGVYGASTLQVVNPEPNSSYTWATLDGNIVSQTGSSAIADAPGTYVVTQYLQASCPAYATDTVVITYDPYCSLLDDALGDFSGKQNGSQVQLKWNLIRDASLQFDIERSTDGLHFTSSGIAYQIPKVFSADYKALDNIGEVHNGFIYYRLKITAAGGKTSYSKVVRIAIDDVQNSGLKLTPNPVKNKFSVSYFSDRPGTAQWFIYDVAGKLIRQSSTGVLKGWFVFEVNKLAGLKNGSYLFKIVKGDDVQTTKFIVHQ
jgi:hypothetical protein